MNLLTAEEKKQVFESSYVVQTNRELIDYFKLENLHLNDKLVELSKTFDPCSFQEELVLLIGENKLKGLILTNPSAIRQLGLVFSVKHRLLQQLIETKKPSQVFNQLFEDRIRVQYSTRVFGDPARFSLTFKTVKQKEFCLQVLNYFLTKNFQKKSFKRVGDDTFLGYSLDKYHIPTFGCRYRTSLRVKKRILSSMLEEYSSQPENFLQRLSQVELSLQKADWRLTQGLLQHSIRTCDFALLKTCFDVISNRGTTVRYLSDDISVTDLRITKKTDFGKWRKRTRQLIEFVSMKKELISN